MNKWLGNGLKPPAMIKWRGCGAKQRTSGGVAYYLLKVILEIISNINGHIVEQCTWPTMFKKIIL
jgi:hypothetical protein